MNVLTKNCHIETKERIFTISGLLECTELEAASSSMKDIALVSLSAAVNPPILDAVLKMQRLTTNSKFSEEGDPVTVVSSDYRGD